MSKIIFDLCLYTAMHHDELDKCEMRRYLNDNRIEFKDLNYYGTDLEQTIFPLNSWLSSKEEKLTVNSFPFVMYQTIDTKSTGSTKVVLHRNLQSLKDDILVKVLSKRNKLYNWILKKLHGIA